MQTRPFRRILVGWDCSPGAETALHIAVRLAAGPGGHVTALAVLPALRHAETSEERAQELTVHRQHAENAFEHALRHQTATSEAHVTLRLTEGCDIATSIADQAVEELFDLIVVGRHGAGGTLHPSRVPRDLARIAAVPLLIV